MINKPLAKNPIDNTLPRRQQLRWRIILAFVLVALISIIGVESLTLAIMARQSTDQAFRQLESVIELKHNQIERWLNDSQIALRTFVAEPFVDDITALASTQAETIDQAAQANMNAVLSELVTVSQSVERSNLRFERLFLYTSEGRVVASSDERQIGRVVRTQPFFGSSLIQPVIQSPYYTVGAGELTMFITYPLRNAAGLVIAVVAGELDLEVLATLMLEQSGLGYSGETYLVSQESNYFLTPSRFEGYPMTRSYRSEGIDRVLQEFNGSGIYNDYRSPAIEVIGVYRWIPELQAGLLAEIDTAEAFTGLRQARTITLLIGVFLLMGVIAAGLIFAGRISRPVQALTETAVLVAKGDLSQRVSISSKNEIGVLARVFNRMTIEIQEMRAELEQRVAERTQELQQTLRDREVLLEDLQIAMAEQQRLQATVRGLSMPVVPVLQDIIVMPLVGEIDVQRSQMLIDSLVEGIEIQRAKVALIDITGVPLIDTAAANTLIKLRRTAELLGTKTILVGVRPEIAQTLLSLNLDLKELETRADLRSGIQYALQWLARS